MLAVVAAQTPPQASIPTQLGQLFPSDQKTLEGVVLAYDWTTRNYMEGARVENFIFKAAAHNSSASSSDPTFVRVVLVWHPVDKPRVLPASFYASNKKWHLTLRTTTPFDFVRDFCETKAAPTFSSDVGKGRKVELPRYVSPSVLAPSAGVAKNFSTAVAKRPTSPQMPDPRSMSCMYLERVTPLEP